jgi:hypothetical protein
MGLECEVCKQRQPFVLDGAMYVLDLKLRDHIEVRKCRQCGTAFYAVPLSEWAEVLQQSYG